MRDTPDNDGGEADSDIRNRTEIDEDCGDRVGDGEADTGMHDACLDDDTSGDETEAEKMSVSGDPHPLLLNSSTREDPPPASTEPRSSRLYQDSSISADRGKENWNFISHSTCDSDGIFSIFETKRPPPIPAKKTLSGNPQSSDALSNENNLEFWPQHDTIRAAKLRQINTGILGSVGGFTRKNDDKVKMEGFNVKGDTRQFVAKNFHDTTGGRNISTSCGPEGLECLVCEKRHNIGNNIEAGTPVAVIVSDQNFLPVLPTDDGKCVVVIRVEDGRLFELESIFKDVFKKFLAPVGRLPVGSVVLVGSLAHLASYGHESYTVDLVKVISAMLAAVGGGADVAPYVPIPLGGGV
jgi:hypothetical protein